MFHSHAHVVPREGRPAGAPAPPLLNPVEIERVVPSPGPSFASPGPEIQIVFTILRPSTISEIPNGGFGGIVFRVLPALWLLWAVAPGLSWVDGTWVMGTWVNGAWVDGIWVNGVCAWERDPAFAWAWASAYRFCTILPLMLLNSLLSLSKDRINHRWEAMVRSCSTASRHINV